MENLGADLFILLFRVSTAFVICFISLFLVLQLLKNFNETNRVKAKSKKDLK